MHNKGTVITISQPCYIAVFNNDNTPTGRERPIEKGAKLTVIRDCGSLLKCEWTNREQHCWVPRIYIRLT